MSTKVRLNDVLSINEKLFARKLADEGRALAYKFMLRPEGNEADLTELDLKGVKIVVATRAAETGILYHELRAKVCEELQQIVDSGHPSLRKTTSVQAILDEARSSLD